MDVGYSSRRLLWFFGFYSGNTMERHPFRRISCCTSIAILTSLPFLMSVRIFLDDRSELLEGLSIILAHTFFLINLLVYSWSRGVIEIESSLQSDVFNSRTAAQDRFMARTIRRVKIYEGMVRALVWTSSSFFAIFVPADVESLSLPIWVPVDLGSIFWHAYEVVSLALSLAIFTAADNSVLALIANIAVQFQTLGDSLRNSFGRNPEECYADQENKIRYRLINCVRHHKAILRYIKKMEESLATIFFGKIFVSVLGICLSGFQFLLIPMRNSRIIWCVLYSMGYLMQILSCCMFAEEIIVQSSRIVRSCFAADWYVCDAGTKKILLIIMERARESTALKAGPFFTLSLRTFVMILRSAYSYYAVLRNIYKK